MDLRRDRKGECERSVGTGRLGMTARAPQGSPRACRATEPHAWRPQGRGSAHRAWHTGAGLPRVGQGDGRRSPSQLQKACRSGQTQEGPGPRFIKGRALQDATLASGSGVGAQQGTQRPPPPG